jgi:hypothetical protein
MADFNQQDLSGSRFRVVDLSGSRFGDVNLSDVLIRGGWADRLELDGDFSELIVNGVDVAPYVAAEMDRLDPERVLMRPTDADGFRAAWPIIEQRWAETVARARRLPPELLHERVEEEWSFIETLRHLVMATDAWVLCALLGDPTPFHPLGLPHAEMDDPTGIVPRDLDARPSLDEVLAVRGERMSTVGSVIAELTDDRLGEMTEPVPGAAYPPTDSYAVRRCLGAILNEEWEHRRFAERDLAILEAGRPG